MPAFEVMDLRQRAVLWAASGYDSYGEAKIGPPVEVAVRWLTKRRTILDAQGNTIALDAQAIVKQFVSENSLIWLGTIASWMEARPALPEVCQVKTYGQTPDIKKRNTRYELGLLRWKSTAPTTTYNYSFREDYTYELREDDGYALRE